MLVFLVAEHLIICILLILLCQISFTASSWAIFHVWWLSWYVQNGDMRDLHRSMFKLICLVTIKNRQKSFVKKNTSLFGGYNHSEESSINKRPYRESPEYDIVFRFEKIYLGQSWMHQVAFHWRYSGIIIRVEPPISLTLIIVMYIGSLAGRFLYCKMYGNFNIWYL